MFKTMFSSRTMFSSKTVLSGPKGICYLFAIQPPRSNLQAWWFPRTASLLTKTCLCLVPAELTGSVLPVGLWQVRGAGGSFSLLALPSHLLWAGCTCCWPG